METRNPAVTPAAAAPTPAPTPKAPAAKPEHDPAAAALLLRLRFPLRPAVPLSETASMTALERTTWEIKVRSQTALFAQTMSLNGPEVASLLDQ